MSGAEILWVRGLVLKAAAITTESGAGEVEALARAAIAFDRRAVANGGGAVIPEHVLRIDALAVHQTVLLLLE